MGATVRRWGKAQQYEQSYWQKVADGIVSGASGQLTWYKNRAEQCEKAILPYMRNRPTGMAQVLEIGSGPIGIATYFGWGERFTVDPLEAFYSKNLVLSSLRNGSVKYMKGSGEALPFDDKKIALVIMDNVLDHTHNPHLVLNEVHRVLEERGVMFFRVNIRTRWGTSLHHLLELLSIDKGHPYSYSLASIGKTLMGHGFSIQKETVGDYINVRTADRKSKRFVDKVKGYTGLSEFWYSAVCLKNAASAG